ncbi:MAG TPA: type 4a pilus biogenesis protein PilO [Candidatus Saccharimonadales bacterium]|nr:type 4a pilus biogenesis protein PilO [Candidatus Saccharimonadales bacterium]
MARTNSFTKRSLITQANRKIVTMTAVAAFLVVFSAIAAKTLVGQIGYQNRVISQEQRAKSNVEADLNARTNLVDAYQAFTTTPQNMLGGNPNGAGPQDGNNAKIVLDALPSTYDFPALVTTIESIIKGQGLSIQNISGTDQEVQAQTNQSSSSPTPQAMPFQFSVQGSYQGIQNLINILQQSIRPMQIQNIQLSGNQASMTAAVSAQTFYQPQKLLNITKETVQ